MLHLTNIQARCEALKRERKARRTDRRGTQPPPAYARQRNRRFPPKMQQQARANLVKLQGWHGSQYWSSRLCTRSYANATAQLASSFATFDCDEEGLPQLVRSNGNPTSHAELGPFVCGELTRQAYHISPVCRLGVLNNLDVPSGSAGSILGKATLLRPPESANQPTNKRTNNHISPLTFF